MEAREAELAKLEEARNKSLGEIEAGNKTTAIQKEKLKSTNDKIKELQRLLQTKDDLVCTDVANVYNIIYSRWHHHVVLHYNIQ